MTFKNVSDNKLTKEGIVMNNDIFNVNSELSIMKNYIADIDHCTSRIIELNDSALLYQTNCKIKTITIATTIYAVLGAIFRPNEIFLGLGVILVCSIILLRNKDRSNRYQNSCILNIATMALSIISSWILEYEEFTVGVFVGRFCAPAITLLAGWIYIVNCNFKLKDQIWRISNGL